MEEQIAKIVDKYLGMMPSDVGCKNWFIMRLNMIEEIKQLQLYNVVGQSEQLPESEKLCRMNQNFVCNCIDNSKCPNF